jgi:hypothetical protein
VNDPLIVERNGKPAGIEDLWKPNPAFLVCCGPSLKDHDLSRLQERGVVSLGVNHGAAAAPVNAWVFSDTQSKFHHGLYLDPAVMTFSPNAKLKRGFYIKTEEGFRRTGLRVRQCPNTFSYQRLTMFVAETFFDTPQAHWGPGKHQPSNTEKIGVLCTMLLGLRLLYYLGVRRIYLLGVDYRGRDGMCYPFPCKKKERNRRYKKEGAMLEALKPVFERKGLEVFNCNPYSACRLFDHVPFDYAVNDCKGSVPNDPLDTMDWYCMKQVNEEVKNHGESKPHHF